MQNDFLKTIETFNNAAIESAKRLGDINLRTMERLAQRHIEATADYLQGGVRQLELMGEGKDVQTVAKDQANLTTELNEKFAEHAKKTAEVLNEVNSELTDWAQDGIKAVAVPLNGAKKAA